MNPPGWVAGRFCVADWDEDGDLDLIASHGRTAKPKTTNGRNDVERRVMSCVLFLNSPCCSYHMRVRFPEICQHGTLARLVYQDTGLLRADRWTFGHAKGHAEPLSSRHFPAVPGVFFRVRRESNVVVSLLAANIHGVDT